MPTTTCALVLALLSSPHGTPLPKVAPQEWPAVREGAEGVNRGNSRVREFRRDLRFPNEAEPGVARGLAGEDDLDGDFAIEGEVAGGENAAHPAAGNLAVYLVAGNLGEVRVRAVGGRRRGHVTFETSKEVDEP